MPGILILIELIGIVAILVGWGFLAAMVVQSVTRLDLNGFGWLELAVLGTAAAYVCAAVLVLFLPLGGLVDLSFATAGVVGFVKGAWTRRQISRPWALGFGLALSSLTAAGTVYTPYNYDAGLYYLPFARFLESDGLSLGLANVHSRFGFNSALAPLASIFHGPIFGRDGLFLVGPAIFLVFAGATLEQVAAGFRSRILDAGHFVALFGVASWLAVFNQTVLSWFGLSPSGDLAAAAATLYCPVALLALCRAVADQDRGAYHRYAVLLPVAVAFAIAAKVAAAPIALLTLLPWAVLGTHRIGSLGLRAMKAGLFCSGIVASLWGLHNLVLSGCLLYPASISCVSWLPWSADKAQVAVVSDIIRAWARAPGEPMQGALNGWGWLAFWQKSMLPYRQFVFTLLKGLPFFLAAALALRLAFRSRSRDERAGLGNRTLLGVWMVNMTGLAFWFFSAPDPRFGLGFMLGTIASSGALLAVSGASYSLDPERTRRFAMLVSGVFIVLLLNNVRLLAVRSTDLTVMPWRTAHVPKTRLMTNGEGLTVAIPLEGDQCWDVAMPCTPELSPHLTRTRIWGRAAYTLHGASTLRQVAARASPGSGPTSDVPQLAPSGRPGN